MLNLWTTFLITYFAVSGSVDEFILSPITVEDNKTGNVADSNSEIRWSPIPNLDRSNSGTYSESSDGWQTFYSMMHDFVSIVFHDGLPTDLIVKAVKLDNELIENYQSYTTYFIGYAVCVGVGVLFVLIFPIVGCCFCCCQCAGKCGGKRYQSQKDSKNACQRNIYTLTVITSGVFLCVGSAAMLVNNDRLSNSLRSVDVSYTENVDTVRQYLNNTVQQVEKIVEDDLDFMEAVISRDLDNVAALVGIPLRETIENETDIRITLIAAGTLSSDLTAIESSLKQINMTTVDLEQPVNTLDGAMTRIRDNLTKIFTDCTTMFSGCPSPPSIASLTPGINLTLFPDMSSQTASIDEAVKTNLSEEIINAEYELDNIPQRVADDSAMVRNDTKAEISKLKDEMDPIVEEFRNINDLLNGDDASLDDIEDDVKEYSDLIQGYDKYRRYTNIGIFTLVLVVIIGSIFGTMCGVLGSGTDVEPHERGCVSNFGGCLLMVSAGVILSVSTIFMLLTTLTFVLGAPLEMAACKNFKDLKRLKEIELEYMGEGSYELGKLIHDNESVPLTFTGLLADCRNNKPIYEATDLQNRFDLENMLNYSKYFDIEGKIDSINIDLGTVNIYSPDLQNQVNEFRKAVSVDFDGFYKEISALTSEESLNNRIHELEAFSLQVQNLSQIYVSVVAEINAIRNLQAKEYKAVTDDITTLNDTLYVMDRSATRIMPLIDALDSGLQDTNNFINVNASDVIKMLLSQYTDRLLSVVDSFVNHVETSVKYEVGKCGAVWDVYENLFINTLCGGLVDSLNGFRFSIGWCVFFFLPSLVFSVKLSKYFRRMKPPEPFLKTASPKSHLSKAGQWLRRNKVSHFDYDKDW